MTMVGEELGGRYRLDALVGAGGMATVYRARDLRLDRDVAVKVLSPNLAADETLAKRFEQEARFLAAQSHPAIVAVYDVGEANGDPYFVMELVQGESLAERLERTGRLPPDEAIPIVTTIAGGLAELHARGFLHRDVKSQNILLGADGSARLADFGLVRSDDTSHELTAPGTTVGTLAYLAPELLRGEAATPASDVYALAVVAYRALTGRSPFAAEALADLIDAQAAPVTRPSEHVPELGTSFDAPVLAGLADVGERPDARGLATALTAGLDAWAASPAGAPSPSRADDAADDSTTTAVTVGDALPGLAIGTVAGASAGVVAGTGALAAGAGDEANVTTDTVLPRQGWLERRRSRQSRHAVGERRGRLLAAWLVGGAALLIGVGLLFALSGAFDRRPAASVAAGATATPRATPTATKAPTQAPQEPFGAVIAAVGEYRTALDGAEGGRDGISGKEARELRDLASRVEAAAQDRNAEETRKRAEELRKKTEEEVRKAGLEGDRAEALLTAARRVDEAAAKLPGGGGDGDGDDG